MAWLDWNNSLAKPSWTPARATIGPIWQILCLSISMAAAGHQRELLENRTVQWRGCLVIGGPGQAPGPVWRAWADYNRSCL